MKKDIIMFTYLLKNLEKIVLILVLFLLAFYVSSAQLANYISPYDCSTNTISQTMQIDADSNDVFETYGLKLCDQDEIQTYTLSGANIRRWPPTGGPTRTIVCNTSGSSISLLETYFNRNGTILAWFHKSADNDTVFFHENEDSYRPRNFGFDSTASNIRAFPNPCNNILNIHYVVREAQNIEMKLLTYEGELLTQIFTAPSGAGEYKLHFDVSGYDEGYYILSYYNGVTTYSVTIAIIR